MKKNFKICALARHTLACGLLFPLAVCVSYVWGLLSGRIETVFRYDALRLIGAACEIYLCCAVVSTGCALLAQYLWKRSRLCR